MVLFYFILLFRIGKVHKTRGGWTEAKIKEPLEANHKMSQGPVDHLRCVGEGKNPNRTEQPIYK